MIAVKHSQVPEDGIRLNYTTKAKSRVNLSTRDCFFSRDVAVTFGNGKVCFRHVPLSYVGKTIKPRKRSKHTYAFSVERSDLIPGDYQFDVDESNEDIKVIYFDEAIDAQG
jgi:hypothetical protein